MLSCFAGSGGALYLKFSSVLVEHTLFYLNWVTAGGVQYSFGGAVACFYQVLDTKLSFYISFII